MAKKVGRKKIGSGWSKMGSYRTESFALRKAESRKHAFDKISVVKGTKGKAWNKSQDVFRVWIK